MRKFAILLRVFQVLILTLFLTPVLMLLVWAVWPKKQLALTVVDKTVLDPSYEEHLSLFWYLNQYKFSHPLHGKIYKPGRDYYGFFPGKLKQYEIKGLTQCTPAQLDSIVENSTHLYFTDTYGIYALEWNAHQAAGERSEIIYGGLSEADLYVLEKAKKAGKTIITEFNTFASPTTAENRAAFEQLFGLKWSGWIGRYIDNLDTLENLEIPRWMKDNFVQQHGSWPFTKPGIVFVNQNDRIEILEDETHLQLAVPEIVTEPKFATANQLPARMPYAFWFDIITSGDHEVVAHFELQPNTLGDSLMRAYGIPNRFPAISKHEAYDYRFFYFSADFADNPVNYKRSYFKGIRFFSEFFYDDSEPTDRLYFFWEYYLPLMDYVFKRKF